MADDEQFDMDDDSDVDEEDEEEVEGSDDDTGFFPIDEPIVHHTTSTQSNPTTATVSKQTKDQTGNKYSNNINASNNYPQDNNFEYVGKFNCVINHNRIFCI